MKFSEKFPRSARIVENESFQKVKRHGVKVRVRCVTVAKLAGQEKRLGIIVSRKTGESFQRNRLKRIARDFFRKNREIFPKGDCIVIFSSGSARLENFQIREILSAALGKLERV